MKLDAESEEELRRGISVSLLPQTLRDAVVVTWELGLRFVWIDCLCIRQDDPGELALEITQMPAIYRNSHITISELKVFKFLHPTKRPSGYISPVQTGTWGRLFSIRPSPIRLSANEPGLSKDTFYRAESCYSQSCGFIGHVANHCPFAAKKQPHCRPCVSKMGQGFMRCISRSTR